MSVEVSGRISIIASYLLSSKYPLEDRVRVLSSMESEVFPEFSSFLSESGEFHSYEYLYNVCGFKASLVELGEVKASDIISLVGMEREFRLKGKVLDGLRRIVESGDSLSLGDIQKKVTEVIPKRVVLEKEFSIREKYKLMKSSPIGICTGIDSLDEVIRGIQYGTMTVVFGYVGHGKTMFVLNLAHRAICSGFNVAFLTLEVPKHILYFQLLSLHSHVYADKFGRSPVPFERMLKSFLTEEEEEYVFDVVDKDLKGEGRGKIKFIEADDLPEYSYWGIKSYFDSQDVFYDVVILDYAQKALPLLVMKGRVSDRLVESALVTSFQRLAIGTGDRDHRIVILAAQANREGWNRAIESNGQYDLRAIADINQLERDAYYVISLFSDDSLRRSGELKISLLKNKSGVITMSPLIVPIHPMYSHIGTIGPQFIGGGGDINSLFGV